MFALLRPEGERAERTRRSMRGMRIDLGSARAAEAARQPTGAPRRPPVTYDHHHDALGILYVAVGYCARFRC